MRNDRGITPVLMGWLYNVQTTKTTTDPFGLIMNEQKKSCIPRNLVFTQKGPEIRQRAPFFAIKLSRN